MNIETQKTVVLAGQRIVVRKLPIKRIVELLEMLKNLPPEVKDEFNRIDKDMKNEEFVSALPTLIALLLPQLADFVIKAIGDEKLNRELLLEKAGIDEVIELVDEFITINNVLGILDRIKKMQALYQRIAPKMAPIQAPKE